MGSSFLAPTTTGSWVNWVQTWDSGIASSATIKIFDLNTAAFRNDFLLDDISLNATVVPIPGAFWLLFSGFLSLDAMCWRRSKAAQLFPGYRGVQLTLDVTGQSSDQQLPDLVRTPMRLLAFEIDDQPFHQHRQMIGVAHRPS